MCRIDYADSDGMWLTEPHEVTSRKAHTCGDCGRTIAAGERYWSAAWLWEHEAVMPVKMCVQCVAAGKWLKVVCGGHLWPGVVEELREHWDEEYDLRSHGLGRLVLFGEKRWQRGNDLIPITDVQRWAEMGLSRVPVSARH